MEADCFEDEDYERDQCLSLAASLTSWLNDSEIKDEQAEEVFRKAAEACPKCVEILNTYATILHRQGKSLEALAVLRAALVENPSYGAALDGLANVRSATVDPWHMRMVNCRARNVAYDAAIRQAVAASPHSCTVLDIGTGTGLLALMAVRSGAGGVLAVEMNSALCSVAAETLGVTETGRCALLHAHSESVDIEHLPRGKSVDIIVTELVDSGLLGERILPVLWDARKRLLKPGGICIPTRAVVHVCLIESAVIRRRARGRVAGVDFQVDEPYTCEKLESLPHTQLTDWYRCMEVQFTCDEFSGAGGPQEMITLQIKTSGVIDAIAVCFDLILTDMEPSIIVTTLPNVAGHGVHPCCTAWDQALFFMDGGNVAVGENVRLHASAKVDQLSFRLLDREKPPIVAIEVGEADLALINDNEWKGFFQNEIQAALAGGIRKSILDLTYGWAACVSVHIAAGAGAERILACNVNEYQANFLKHLKKVEAEKRAGGMQYVASKERDRQLAVVAGCDIVGTESGLMSLPRGQAAHLSAKYDVLIMADLVEGSSGLLRQGALADILYATRFLMNAGFRMVPGGPLQVVCVGLSASYLRKRCRVDPTATTGVNISALNLFGNVTHQSISLATNPLRSRFSTQVDHAVVPMPYLRSTQENTPEYEPDVDPLVALQLHRIDNETTNDVIVNAIGIWFMLGEYTTLGSFLLNKDDPATDNEESSCSHFMQAVHVFLNPVRLKQHQWLQLGLRPHSGHVMHAQTMQGLDTIIEKHILER